jgi:hypothetical protein
MAPNLSWIFLFIILVGLLMVQWHHSAWMSTIRNEYASHGGKFYVDRPPVPLQRAVRNISILCAGAGVISFFLNRQIGLTTGQVFLMLVVFLLLYRNALFFGAPTTYVITSSGIAIYFAPTNLDYRLFLNFDEISRFERCRFQKDKGLTKRIEKLFIAPKDIEALWESP